jgi:ATP-dependent DNA helicase RecQ
LLNAIKWLKIDLKTGEIIEMKPITFIDTEIGIQSKMLQDIGAVKVSGQTFHSIYITEFRQFISDSEFLCGHNIIDFDAKYLDKYINLSEFVLVDTLYWSPLLFPAKPYHRLLKDDKLQADELNNPLNDAQKAKDLFFDEVNQFNRLDEDLKRIYFHLLRNQKEFSGFFSYAGYSDSGTDIENSIKNRFKSEICSHADIQNVISQNPVELAYCLALIQVGDKYSITPPWVLKRFPDVQRIMYLLRDNRCVTGCDYCNKSLDTHLGLKKFFNFDKFRTYNGEPLQEEAAEAAVDHKSLLAIFPTGGGKSLTFQLPALMQGESVKGLTVVISPLQSLMKDQVDNLENQGIVDAVTINGLLDPIERAKSFERVADGTASLLYISPESLRSRTIEHLLLGRNIVRFVIDEAHCFSAWDKILG